jgi:hypothetical protein
MIATIQIIFGTMKKITIVLTAALTILLIMVIPTITVLTTITILLLIIGI